MFDYLPDKQEIHKISREWICNIYASVLKSVFTDWVHLKTSPAGAIVSQAAKK